MTDRNKRPPGNSPEPVFPTTAAAAASRRSKMTDRYALSDYVPQELAQDQDFSFQDSAIVLITEISRLYDHLNQHYARCNDITPSQIQLLLILIQRGPLRMVELSERLGRSPSNLTPITRQLEERGLVSRSRDMRDGRSILISVTPAGRAIMIDMYLEINRDAQAEGIGISLGHRRQIIESLEILSTFLRGLHRAVSLAGCQENEDSEYSEYGEEAYCADMEAARD
ncbi:MAG: MarR family transcriptional regulator [Bacillota bacterium]|nr:MarR family transcriptional regulator [Bacillota bacterium]